MLTIIVKFYLFKISLNRHPSYPRPSSVWGVGCWTNGGNAIHRKSKFSVEIHGGQGRAPEEESDIRASDRVWVKFKPKLMWRGNLAISWGSHREAHPRPFHLNYTKLPTRPKAPQNYRYISLPRFLFIFSQLSPTGIAVRWLLFPKRKHFHLKQQWALANSSVACLSNVI